MDPVVPDPLGGGPPGKDGKTAKGIPHTTVVSSLLARDQSTMTLPEAARVETEIAPRQWLIALDKGFGSLADRERYKVAVIKAEADVHEEKERLRLEKEAAEVKLKAVEQAALKAEEGRRTAEEESEIAVAQVREAEEAALRARVTTHAVQLENERLRRELAILRGMS